MSYQTLHDLTSAVFSSQGPPCSLNSGHGDLPSDVRICQGLSRRASQRAPPRCSRPPYFALLTTVPASLSGNIPPQRSHWGCPAPAIFCSLIILAHSFQFFSSLELSTILITSLCVLVSCCSLQLDGKLPGCRAPSALLTAVFPASLATVAACKRHAE